MGPGKCFGLYRISEYSGFILVNRHTLQPSIDDRTNNTQSKHWATRTPLEMATKMMGNPISMHIYYQISILFCLECLYACKSVLFDKIHKCIGKIFRNANVVYDTCVEKYCLSMLLIPWIINVGFTG